MEYVCKYSTTTIKWAGSRYCAEIFPQLCSNKKGWITDVKPLPGSFAITLRKKLKTMMPDIYIYPKGYKQSGLLF